MNVLDYWITTPDQMLYVHEEMLQRMAAYIEDLENPREERLKLVPIVGEEHCYIWDGPSGDEDWQVNLRQLMQDVASSDSFMRHQTVNFCLLAEVAASIAQRRQYAWTQGMEPVRIYETICGWLTDACFKSLQFDW